VQNLPPCYLVFYESEFHVQRGASGRTSEDCAAPGIEEVGLGEAVGTECSLSVQFIFSVAAHCSGLKHASDCYTVFFSVLPIF
jgi:hypothetical protein